jgi:hypothetical protein
MIMTGGHLQAGEPSDPDVQELPRMRSCTTDRPVGLYALTLVAVVAIRCLPLAEDGALTPEHHPWLSSTAARADGPPGGWATCPVLTEMVGLGGRPAFIQHHSAGH